MAGLDKGRDELDEGGHGGGGRRANLSLGCCSWASGSEIKNQQSQLLAKIEVSKVKVKLTQSTLCF